MKIQCDACHKKVASVFCYTEEMALCSLCYHNKPDHQTFSFSYPVQKHIPICDVCQETKAFIFCLEHRAILCRNCDTLEHAVDKLAKRHNRFILTGAKLCTGDKNVGENESKKEHNQLESECGGSSSNSNRNPIQMGPGTPGRSLLDMSSDDPYGLCKKKGAGSGAGAIFEDTDLGCYLNSLQSPKRS